jgi:hypothetical protein
MSIEGLRWAGGFGFDVFNVLNVLMLTEEYDGKLERGK